MVSSKRLRTGKVRLGTGHWATGRGVQAGQKECVVDVDEEGSE